MQDKWFTRGLIAFLLLCGAFFAWFVPYTIKTQQAERDRVRASGYEAGLYGQPPTACPYSEGWGGSPHKRESWLSGWSAGNREKK